MAENIFSRRRLHLCYVLKRAADSEKDHSKWNPPCVIGNFESNSYYLFQILEINNPSHEAIFQNDFFQKF